MHGQAEPCLEILPISMTSQTKVLASHPRTISSSSERCHKALADSCHTYHLYLAGFEQQLSDEAKIRRKLSKRLALAAGTSKRGVQGRMLERSDVMCTQNDLQPGDATRLHSQGRT